MKRRFRRHVSDSMSFDSFLDLVCNLIGGLLLVAVIAALSLGNDVFDVFTPVEREVKNAAPLKFAVTTAGIYPMNQETAIQKLKEQANRTPYEKRIVAETDFWRWTFDFDLKQLFCELKATPPPITEKNISAIHEKLNQLKAALKEKERKHFFVSFIIAPENEAFRIFRLARKELWANNISVGWVPIDPRKTLVFGEGGISLAPQ